MLDNHCGVTLGRIGELQSTCNSSIDRSSDISCRIINDNIATAPRGLPAIEAALLTVGAFHDDCPG